MGWSPSVNIPHKCALKNREDTLNAANISPEVIANEENPDPIIRIHVDYLDETEHEEYR